VPSYLTFTCLQGSVWRIYTAGRFQQEIRFVDAGIQRPQREQERARFFPSRGPTKLSHAWRYAERPGTEHPPTQGKHVQSSSELRKVQGESGEGSIARAEPPPWVGSAARLSLFSLPGIRNASASRKTGARRFVRDAKSSAQKVFL
jgi:hypothetical protein